MNKSREVINIIDESVSLRESIVVGDFVSGKDQAWLNLWWDWFCTDSVAKKLFPKLQKSLKRLMSKAGVNASMHVFATENPDTGGNSYVRLKFQSVEKGPVKIVIEYDRKGSNITNPRVYKGDLKTSKPL